MYLPRSHTGNIFPSWIVVVRRHHVYVREFHRPSCNSVQFAVSKSEINWRKWPAPFCHRLIWFICTYLIESTEFFYPIY
jgi:hypothetical protein